MKDRKLTSRLRLLHIQQAIGTIRRFVEGVDKETFEKNDLIHHAVLMQFIIIGEAINHVDEAILIKYPYPWYKIKSFRNFVAHEYFNIKLSAVWEITQQELEPLSELIDYIIAQEFE